MDKNIEVFNKTYEEAIQAFMHKFGRAPLIPGQQVELDQATGRSGHTVQYSEVRAEEIPFIENKIVLRKKLFDSTKRNPVIINGFKHTIYYYNKIEMKNIPSTNNRAWYVQVPEMCATLARGQRIYAGAPATDFISPSDVTMPTSNKPFIGTASQSNAKNALYKHLSQSELQGIQPDYIKQFDEEATTPMGVLSDGYAAVIFYKKLDGTFEMISSNYYNFDYFTGVLTFNSTVKNKDLKLWKEQGIFIEAFQYIGKKVLDYFKELELLISKANEAIDKVKNESISVQRVKFSTADATKSEEIEKFEDFSSPNFSTTVKQRWVRNYTVKIPDYCWELTFDKFDQPELQELNINTGGVFITDIKHEVEEIPGVNNEIYYQHWSIITFQLEVLKEESDVAKYGDKPILAWIEALDENTNAIYKRPICGDYNLIATTFTRYDGRCIEILPDKTLKRYINDIRTK